MTAPLQVKAVQEAEIHIDAPPEQVYALISDVTRTGEWSPECHRCKWVNGTTGPVVGARFRGYNRYRWLRWSRLNEVLATDPGREFALKVLPDWVNKDSSIWRYRLEAQDGVRGCRKALKCWNGLAFSSACSRYLRGAMTI